MSVTPRIFISATSGDLKSHRATVAAALKKLETYAEVQDDWPPDYHSVEAMIRRRLKDCDAVIHLAGLRYGAEPVNGPPGVPRRSYTQMEYHLARSMGKPVYTFLLPDSYPYDSPASSEDDERCILQQAHRAQIAADNHLYYCPADGACLHTEVVSLQPLVEKLRAVLRRQRLTMAAVITAFVLISAGIAWAVLREKEVNLRQAEAIAELQKPESAEVKFFKEIQLLRSRSPQAAVARAGGGTGHAEQMSYADALAAVARDHGLTADALRGMLDAFATRVLADPQAGEYERAVAEFHRRNFDSAISLATSAAESAEKEMKEKRDKAIAAWTLVGDSEKERIHYRPALAEYQKALALGDRVADPNAWTGLAMNVARMQNELAAWKEAELLSREILRLREAHSGKDAPETAAALNNLALLLLDTNRMAAAEPLLVRALAINEALFGKDHPEVASALNNLAALLHATNRAAEAELLYRRALANDEASFGREHPHVARGLNNLALLLHDTNRPAEAEPLMKRALAMDEAAFGKEHPDVARDLGNLAQLLLMTNRPTEAEPLMRRALEIDEASLGIDHPKVATDLNNLAQLLQATERWVEAEPLMKRALAIFESSFGGEHPHVARALNNLAQLFQDTKRRAEAEPLLKRALAIFETSFGGSHPDVAAALNNLAHLLQATNRVAEAEPLMRRALASDEASFGKDHPKVATRLNNLALLLMATNRLAEAEPLLRRTVEILVACTTATGHLHPRLQAAAESYGLVLTEMGDTREQAREKVLKILEPIEGK